MGKGVVTSFTNFTPGNSGETVTFNFSEITGKPLRKGNPPKKNIPLKKGHRTDRSRNLCSWFFFYMATFVCFSLSREEKLNTTRFGLASFFFLGGGWTWLMAFWDLFYLEENAMQILPWHDFLLRLFCQRSGTLRPGYECFTPKTKQTSPFSKQKKRGNNLGRDSTPILHHLDLLLDLRIMGFPFEMPKNKRYFQDSQFMMNRMTKLKKRFYAVWPANDLNEHFWSCKLSRQWM